MKTIRVRYIATLQDQRGLPEEALLTEAMTPEELYRDLRMAHNFSLTHLDMRAALNDDFVPMNTPLMAGDTVAFVPPSN
ncbi:MAG: MoaD/ThiS family protein [Fimbriimonas sp.]